METALITWIIVAVLAVGILLNSLLHSNSHVEKASRHHLRFIEMGSECDELFIPGDINSQHDSDIIEYEEELEVD